MSTYLTSQPLVQILLSTWNGAQWLPDLLESLLRQTYPHWQILIRDDGSHDQTLKQLVAWQARYPERVSELIISPQRIGRQGSFSALVQHSRADYLMFCDQDDVWLPEKIEWQLEAMLKLEAQFGATHPLLAHSDLVMVDAHKQLLNASFWNYRGFDLQQRKQAYLLNNNVTGCATLFNRSAAQLAFPLPPEALHHDRWLALVCAWFGHIEPLAQPTILYRQHTENAIGAVPSVTWGDLDQRIRGWSQQARAFLRQFSAQLEKADCQFVEAVAVLQTIQGWERRRHVMQHRLFKQGMMENLALLLLSK